MVFFKQFNVAQCFSGLFSYLFEFNLIVYWVTKRLLNSLTALLGPDSVRSYSTRRVPSVCTSQLKSWFDTDLST